MYKEQYLSLYVDCYNKIIDIVSLIKEFIYPGEYNFSRIDENLSLEEKLRYIKNDLENEAFTEEVDYTFIELLEFFYPEEEKDYVVEDVEEINEVGLNKLNILYDKLKSKYLPFVKRITISEFPDRESRKVSDDEIWELALSNCTDKIEEKIEEIVWTIMDCKNLELIDKILKETYYLDDIEFNRYAGERNKDKSSIKRNNPNDKIKCNFKLFNSCFEDIYGQDEALKAIEKVLKRNIFLHNAEDIKEVKTKRGPLATFMFYGPTGTGKTECAKRIAEFVFKNERKILILDMNSYKDGKVGSSAIKGHPEGYINSEKGTDFTRFLKANTSGIIVLDEFEKADREVREIFMTMLDEGEFKDALGNIYDLSSYIFIATTNASEQFESKKKVSIGFSSTIDKKEEIKKSEREIKEGLREIFTAPIMNRFNNLVHFRKIEYNDAVDICKSLIDKMCKTFENKRFRGMTPKITVNNVDQIVDLILKECNYEKDGVRSLKNVVNDLIGSNIIEEILNNNDNILVDCDGSDIVVKKNMVVKR